MPKRSRKIKRKIPALLSRCKAVAGRYSVISMIRCFVVDALLLMPESGEANTPCPACRANRRMVSP